MTRRPMAVPALLYPRAGTMAERVLHFIRDNEGCSTNALWNGLKINPSPARTCIKNLLERKFIEDRPEGGQHRWFITERGREAC